MSNGNISAQTGQGTSPCEESKDILLPCKKELCSEKTIQKGVAKAAMTTKETYIANRNNKVCYVLKADETTRLYRNIDYYVAIDANTRSETIEKSIDDLVKKSADLDKAIGEAVKSIKMIKDKSVELKAKACDLDTQRKDSCNTQQLNILNNHFLSTNNKCVVVSPGDVTTPFQDFNAIVEYLLTKTGIVYSGADEAFKSAVSIAGIQTFSNFKSLKELSKQLTLCIKEFKKNIDDNIKSNAEDLKKAQDDLAKSVQEVSLRTLDEHKESVKYEGIAFTVDFICNPVCDNLGDIDELCCKVMKTFCGDDVPCGDGGKPGYTAPEID